jgi:hypothetical protein
MTKIDPRAIKLARFMASWYFLNFNIHAKVVLLLVLQKQKVVNTVHPHQL